MKHDFSKKLERKGTDCWKWDVESAEFSMGVADTDFSVAQPIVDALVQKVQSGALAYGSGPEKFCKAISGYYKRRHDLEVDPTSIRHAPGLMVALKLLLEAFTMPGDMVLIQPPVYFNFAVTIQKNGRQPVDNPLIYDEGNHTYSIDFADLEQKAQDPRVKMMVFCNPHNPACRAWTREEMERVFEICHRNHVLLVSDEVHGDIYYNGHRHTVFHALSKEARENTIVMSADGKTFNLHGFYTSYLIIPNKRFQTQFDLVYENNHFDYSVMGCLASEVAFGGQCDYYIDQLVEYLQGNLEYLVRFLVEHDIGVSMADPQATYLMWLDFRKWGLPNQQLHQLLRDNGVWLGAGERFGVGGETFMRMNIACHRDTLVGALDRLKEIYDRKINV